MDTTVVSVIITIAASIAGFLVSYLISSKTGKQQVLAAETRAKEIIEDAQKNSENILREKMIEVWNQVPDDAPAG